MHASAPKLSPQRGPCPTRAVRSGLALPVALILLLVVTVVGLAAMRGTLLQQMMTAHFYDRELAFQAAEAGLRAGAAAITAAPAQIYNCGPGGSLCQADPFKDPNLPSGFIIDVPSGTGAGSFLRGIVNPTQPQYVVQNMGSAVLTNNGETQSGSHYGYQNANKGSAATAIFYRITARSGDPAKVGARAVVTLQAMYRQ